MILFENIKKLIFNGTVPEVIFFQPACGKGRSQMQPQFPANAKNDLVKGRLLTRYGVAIEPVCVVGLGRHFEVDVEIELEVEKFLTDLSGDYLFRRRPVLPPLSTPHYLLFTPSP